MLTCYLAETVGTGPRSPHQLKFDFYIRIISIFLGTPSDVNNLITAASYHLDTREMSFSRKFHIFDL